MRRRTLLLGTAATMAAAGCSRATGASPSASLAVVPSGPAPVVSWSLTGGYLSAGRLALRPARLVVYATGEVIADAAYRSDLPAADVASLITRLTGDLQNTDVAKRRDSVAVVADAPITVFSVRSAHGTYAATAASLDELRAKSAYAAAMYDARDRIGSTHQRVVSSGQPYTADRVRLVLEVATSAATEVQPWPTGIDLPQRNRARDVTIVDLDAQPARNAVRQLSRDLDLNGGWSAYLTPEGELLRACWRYLLPHE